MMLRPDWWGMGKKELKQKTLPFEKVAEQPGEGSSEEATGGQATNTSLAMEPQLSAILQEMRAGFQSIDS